MEADARVCRVRRCPNRVQSWQTILVFGSVSQYVEGLSILVAVILEAR